MAPRRITPALPSALVAVAIVVGSACAELPQVASGTCGNRVVEKGEECDWFGRDGFDCRRADPSAGGCRLECKADGTCPTGYGCGTDMICRRPSGAFDYDPKGAVRISGFVRRARLGDFDGDKRADVVGETLTDLRVHYFDGKSAPARSVVLQGSGPTAVGNLTSDALSSVAVGSNNTLSVWRGQSDRTLATVLYPTLPLPTSGDLRMLVADGLSPKAGLTYLGDELFFALGSASSTAFFPARQDPANPVQLFDVPRPLGEIVGPAIARFQNFPQCDGFAYGLHKSSTVYVYGICATDSLWAQKANPRPIAASDTLDAATSRIVAGRVNSDAIADLLIQHASGVDVAYGVGDGTFDSSPFVFSNGNGLTSKYLKYAPQNRAPRILAVGDLDGDGQGDVVDTAGIWLTSLGAYGYSTVITMASVLDVNGDKKNDVVATTGLGTLFLFGTGSKFLNPAFYALDAVPDKMTVADLDGDQLPDILVATRTDAATAALWVQWSQTAQFPQAPVFVGTLPTVVSMASGRLAPYLLAASGNTALWSTAMAPMIVRRARDGALQAPLLVGDSSRVLTSPFLLSKQTSSGTTGFGEIASLVVGHFDDSGHEGFAALAFDLGATSLEAPRLWVVPSQGDAELDPASVLRTEAELPVARVQNDTTLRLWQEPLMAAVDLDRDGVDELLTLAPPDLLPALPLAKTGKLFVSTMTPKGFDTTSLEVGAAGASFLTNRGWGLRTVDVDGDGHRDVLVMYMDAERHPQLRVMLNDGSSTLDTSRLIEVPMPALGASELAIDFATVRTDGATGRRSIALLTSQRLWIIPWAQGQSSFAPPVQQGSSSTSNGGRSIAAGDVDGDGVEDLVVADAQGIAVYFGKELAP